ncbi:MAG: hypothetical protein QCI00_10215, partial [Candidatus Thermoplasmatota archaeon]|nr:hypothetical protein [Candidatus Thermoplasmatota archaeon]
MKNIVHFNSIRIRGYRGRNFDLVMNPPGKHSVFVLDGNTGKTTTIELLRWCFLFKESEAEGKFRHMWNNPAHIFDHDIEGSQECSVAIELTDGEHTYLFSRVSKGEYDNNTDDEGQVIGDRVLSIEDNLEIDRGASVFHGDQASINLNSKFRFDQCAEYFCFDGEKAKDVLIMASDVKNLDFIQNMINRRATHPILNKYVKYLDKLQQKVYDKAKSKVTDQGKTRKLNELSTFITSKDELLEENRDLEFQYKTIDRIVTEYANERDDVINKLVEVASDNQRKRDEYQAKCDQSIDIISDRRNELYKHSLNWLSNIDINYINALKYYVRESGKLPDPYYEDLIEECLSSNKCKICGRDLDKASIEWITKLEKLTASHEVQNFLLSDLFIDEILIHSENIYEEIIGKSNDLEMLRNAKESLKMSDLERTLRDEEKKLDYKIRQNESKLTTIE